MAVNASDGTVWVVDTGNHAIRRVISRFNASYTIGTRNGATASSGSADGRADGAGVATNVGSLSSPYAAAISGNMMYIADRCACTPAVTLRFTRLSRLLLLTKLSFFPSPGQGEQLIAHMECNNSDLIHSDSVASIIFAFRNCNGGKWATAVPFRQPCKCQVAHCAVHAPRSGCPAFHVITYNPLPLPPPPPNLQRLRIFDLAANTSSVLLGTPTAAAFPGLSSPVGVFATSNTLFFADSGNNRIRKIVLNATFMPNGSAITVAGPGRQAIDGTLDSAMFANPQSVAVSPTGDIFISGGVPLASCMCILCAGPWATMAV